MKMTRLPEDVRFLISQYGSSANVSEERWFEEIRTLDPSFSLEAILYAIEQWNKTEIIIQDNYYHTIYKLLSSITYYINEYNRTIFVTSNEVNDKAIDNLYDLLIIKYQFDVQKFRDSNYSQYGVKFIHKSQMEEVYNYFRAIYIHNISNPIDIVLAVKTLDIEMESLHSILYTNKSYTLPTSISNVRYDSNIVNSIQNIYPSFSLREEYFKRSNYEQAIRRLKKNPIYSIIAKYKKNINNLYYTENRLVISFEPDIEDKLPQGWNKGYSIIEYDGDDKYELFISLMAFVWDKRPYTLNYSHINTIEIGIPYNFDL